MGKEDIKTYNLLKEENEFSFWQEKESVSPYLETTFNGVNGDEAIDECLKKRRLDYNKINGG